MPNIQTKELELLEFPQIFGEYRYEFIASSSKNGMLVFVKYQDKSFFLQIIKRESDYLIKGDKLTRVSPISIIQNALKGFSSLHNLELTYSNIENKNEKHKIKSDYTILKSAKEFANSLSYDKEIWVEVGFGSGRHLLHLALNNPEVNFIGIEIHRPSIEQVIKQCKLQNIQNIQISDFDARVFLQLLKSNSLGKIFVHFPVPWDKKPHRRVISEAFIKESLRALKKGGTLELRTDSENYFSYSFETLNKFQNYDIKIRKNHNLEISSKYEDRWKKQEKNIYDITLINHEQSESKKKMKELEFDFYPDFQKVKDKFTNHTIKGKDFFVHFEEIYEIDYECGVIKLSLGSFEKCEHKYLLFNNKMIQYFPMRALPIEQNLKSHKIIREYLNV